MRLARPWVSSQSSSCGRQMSRLCRALSTSTSEFAALLTYVSDPCTPRCQLARGVASAHAGQRRLVLVWAGGAATVVRVSHPRGNSTRRWWYSPLIYVSLGHTRRHDRGPVLAERANGTHPSPRNSGLQRKGATPPWTGPWVPASASARSVGCVLDLDSPPLSPSSSLLSLPFSSLLPPPTSLLPPPFSSLLFCLFLPNL